MKKMIFAMMIAAGLLGTTFANAQTAGKKAPKDSKHVTVNTAKTSKATTADSKKPETTTTPGKKTKTKVKAKEVKAK